MWKLIPQARKRTNDSRWAVILDEVVIPEDSWWRKVWALKKPGGGGYKAREEQRVQDQKGGDRRQRDHQPGCNGEVTRSQTQLQSWDILMILKALISIASSWARCEAGSARPRGESSTPSSCGWRPWRWIGVQVCQVRTLYDGGCPVSCWLRWPTLKSGLPKKDHGW